MQYDEWGQQQQQQGIPYQPPPMYTAPVPYINQDPYNNTMPPQTYNQFY
jgi:hypothetical protein